MLASNHIDGNGFGGTEDEPLSIYAVNGFTDLNITGSNDWNSSTFHEGTSIMYCQDDFSSSCEMTMDPEWSSFPSNPWQCTGSSICDTPSDWRVANANLDELGAAHLNVGSGKGAQKYFLWGFLITILGCYLVFCAMLCCCLGKVLCRAKHPKTDRSITKTQQEGTRTGTGTSTGTGNSFNSGTDCDLSHEAEDVAVFVLRSVHTPSPRVRRATSDGGTMDIIRGFDNAFGHGFDMDAEDVSFSPASTGSSTMATMITKEAAEYY